MAGWVKLHRKVLDNEVYRHDPTAWRVFETLLLLADSKTGNWSGGMYQLSDYTQIKRETLYKAILRLESTEMVKRTVDSRYTMYHLCNWREYQTDSKQPVNSQETASNTLTRNKNKNKNIYTSSSKELNVAHEWIAKLFNKDIARFKLTDKRKTMLKNRLSELGKDNFKAAFKAISNSSFHRGENNTGWKIDNDPYWLLANAERAEKWANMEVETESVNDRLAREYANRK